MVRPAALIVPMTVLLLSACQSNLAEQAAAPETPPGQVSASPGEATQPIDAQRAQQVLSDLCIRHAPAFSGIAADAARNGFAPGTGPTLPGSDYRLVTFYPHRSESVLIRIIGRRCFMTFASNDSSEDLEQALTALETPAVSIRFVQRAGEDSRQVYEAQAVPID